jgi:outer membrane protein assembly factor BamB
LVGSGAVPDLVIVGTNQTHVIAFNAATGAKVWDQTLGTPVPQSNLACNGNINPYGITGTPVIDEATRTIYVNTMTLNGTTVQHMVHALDANTGMERTGGWPVDLNAKVTSFSSRLQNRSVRWTHRRLR